MNSAPLPSAARKKALLFLAFLLAAALGFTQRVVSLAPGLTEIIFAVGRGDTLVGVTKFCDFPPSAKSVAKVGGFLDFNLEALIALTPDIVVGYPEHAGKLRLLPRQIRTVLVGHESLSDLLRSIPEIGRVLGAEIQAERLADSLNSTLREISRRAAGRKKIRVLLVAGRSSGELKNMFIIGRGDFLNDLLAIAGGVNAYTGAVPYPSISLEAAVFLNPEFILEVSAYHEGIPEAKILELWRPCMMVTAVAKRQIRVIRDSFWLRPGPRVGQIAAALASMLHEPGDPARAVHD